MKRETLWFWLWFTQGLLMQMIDVITTADFVPGQRGGSYLLRIEVADELVVRFGHFQGGEVVRAPAGVYVYVGSALRGLGSRLLRHASRSQFDAQTIYTPMQSHFQEWGLTSPGWRPRPKTLCWHVDYLLEETAVTLTHVLLIRSQQNWEREVARLLLAEEGVRPLARGLGASDDQGQTHLLAAPASLAWWKGLRGIFD
ncbi:MAG: GIY-YIG nuclease family protein [Anaerolinea sp.]|nr:GIY-YIG nuclease family protein [Anaerolinea sp.]